MTMSLSDLRVLEIGQEISAPYCCKLLADLGADVVKIEQQGIGDPFRSVGSFPNDANDQTVGALFRYLNTNKRSVAIDLKSKNGAEKVLDFVQTTDLIIENLGVGVLESFGLGFEQLKNANPSIVVVKISDFGQEGPYSRIPATDFVVQAASAWVSKFNALTPEPVSVGGRVSDYMTAIHAACATLTAYRMAADLKEAVLVDVSKQECLLSTRPQPALFLEALQSLGMGVSEDRIFPVPGIVRCKDGLVAVDVLTAQHFADCCQMMEVPEYIPKQMDLNVAGPLLDQFYKDIEPWLMERSVEEIVDLSQAFRIPAAPVGDGQSLPQMRQLKDRSFYVKSPEGDFIQPSFPYRLEKSPASIRSSAPQLGEHNAEVAKTWEVRDPGNRPGTERQDVEYLPFQGLKVLDLGTFWAGSYVGCYLGAMGADIIKIESISRPDGWRYSGCFPEQGKDWYEQGPMFQGGNLNKRDLTLDLRSEDGKRIMDRLVAGADILIENFPPRVIENLGYGVSRLRELNPRMIVVRMPGFGLEGPWRDYVSWAAPIEQAGGIAWVTGSPEHKPVFPNGAADPIASMHGLTALLAALRHREKTGDAQLIEVAQIEAAASLTAEQVIAYSMTEKLVTRKSNRSDNMAPQGVYSCADDDRVAISIRDDKEWLRFIDQMGSPEWARNTKFSTLSGRKDHHDELDTLISQWSRVQKADEVVDQLLSAGIPVAKLLLSSAMYNDPHLKARGFYQPVVHPVSGERRYPGWPMRQNPGPARHHRFSAPTLGQHNREILVDELGLTEADYKELARKEVIGTVPKGLS